MSAETIDHATLSRLVEAGAVRGAHVVGRAGGWALHVEYGATASTLAAQRSRRPRLFKRMDTLVAYLRQVGISQFDVDSAGHEAGTAESRARPDRAAALRQTHAASAHDRWFRAQVDEALREADGPRPGWVSNDDAKAAWSQRRAVLQSALDGEGRKV